MSGGQDGSETPSAPESPSPQPPEEPTEPAGEDGAEPAGEDAAEPVDEETAESRRPRLLPVWILLGAAALSGGAWAVMEHVGGGPPVEEATVPLIAASAEPWKVRPADPGGMEIPNQGTLIYETLKTADPEEAPERVLPPPEQPLRPPQPEADRAEELAVAASGATTDIAASQPGAESLGEPAPVQVDEAPIAETGDAVPDLADPELTEPEIPELEATEPVLVVEAPPPEPYAAWPETIPRPHPPKPGTRMAAAVDISPLSEVGAASRTDEAPPPELEPTASVEGLPELDPETLALVEELLQREAAGSSAPVQQVSAGGVPLPVFKPLRSARAVPDALTIESTAPAVREPAPTVSRTWRYIQLGAAPRRGPLEGHWEMLRQRHEDVLVGLSPLIMPVDSGDSGITYRLRAGPLSNEETARRVCAQLRARGLECFVPRD